MVLGDLVTYGSLGYLYFPNLSAAVILLIVIPVVALFAIGVNIIISSRANDVTYRHATWGIRIPSDYGYLWGWFVSHLRAQCH